MAPSAQFRPYRPETDFLAIRDLLVATHRDFAQPVNWRLERWNYARHFVTPLFGQWGRGKGSVAEGAAAVRWWEETIGVWEDGGRIVAVVHAECPRYGEAWIERRPGCEALFGDLLAYAEATYADPATGAEVRIYDHDGPLQASARARGYRRDVARPEWDSAFLTADLAAPPLPPGYVVRSMADDDDLDRRRELLGRAFDHTDPAEWASRETYREMQRAPDYCPDLDLYVVGPQGEYVSCCVIWYDAHNRMGVLEPVGTHPDHRRRGFGRAAILEAVRRVAALGAERVWVGADKPFYLAIGFRRRIVSYPWNKPGQAVAPTPADHSAV